MYPKTRIFSLIRNLYPIRLLLLLIVFLLIGIGIITYKVNNEIYKVTENRHAAYAELLHLSDFRSIYSLANRDFNEYIVSDVRDIPPLNNYLSNLRVNFNILEKMFNSRNIQAEQLSALIKMTLINSMQ